MSYEKKTWETGEVITADGLNHLEQGVADCGGGGVLVAEVIATYNGVSYECTSDTTFEELEQAYSAGKAIVARLMINPDDSTSEAYWDRKDLSITAYSPGLGFGFVLDYHHNGANVRYVLGANFYEPIWTFSLTPIS